jgi:hypothetical protein
MTVTAITPSGDVVVSVGAGVASERESDGGGNRRSSIVVAAQGRQLNSARLARLGSPTTTAFFASLCTVAYALSFKNLV